MKKPLISIIVPIYNAEKYLNQCIESILEQTYENIELILVNDGSKDKSLEICNIWSKKDKRVVAINKTNGGVASARNAGLDIAKGQLITFVDNDDIVEKNIYEKMYSDMLTHNADIVMCNSRSFTSLESRSDKGYQNYEPFEISNKELVHRMLSFEKIFCSSVWSKLYTKEIIGNVRFKEEITLGDDYYFNGVIYPKVKCFYYNATPLYNYRIREGSICRSGVGAHFFDKYKVAGFLKEELQQYDFIKQVEIEKFELSVLYEIVYNLFFEKADRAILKTWKNKLLERFKSVKKNSKVSIKHIVKINMLVYFPNLYMKLTSI